MNIVCSWEGRGQGRREVEREGGRGLVCRRWHDATRVLPCYHMIQQQTRVADDMLLRYIFFLTKEINSSLILRNLYP